MLVAGEKVAKLADFKFLKIREAVLAESAERGGG